MSMRAARPATGEEPPEPVAMGSYPPDDVTFLLTDLTDVDLEQDARERERQMQGGGHYSESLPHEYRPTAEYRALFDDLLEREAGRTAELVLALADVLLEAKGEDVVLVSLARAGTPVGVLLRRAIAHLTGREVPHASISIIRDRGIDEVALRWLLRRHAPERLQFVDGWTGKGVINRELAAALDDFAGRSGVRLDPELAVLCDPAYACRRYATRQDRIVPSSCLNSTVSGLVSRSVLNDALIAPGMFHGAKTYPAFAPDDVSLRFVEAVQDRFADATPGAAGLLAGQEHDPAPDGRGMRDVATIGERFGLRDVNLVKPGVGETTRVLLRRVPWKVLVHPEADAVALRHVRLLCEQRGVEVVPYAEMSYACCGLIEPLGGAVQ